MTPISGHLTESVFFSGCCSRCSQTQQKLSLQTQYKMLGNNNYVSKQMACSDTSYVNMKPRRQVVRQHAMK